jgi:hypothetical protein
LCVTAALSSRLRRYLTSRIPHQLLGNSQEVFQNAASNSTPTSFSLKCTWVQGTKVSKCYGCGGIIKNPPENRPDNLILFCRVIREYRDRITGQLQRSSFPQNVHFHLRRECIVMRYPAFHVGLLSITPELEFSYASSGTCCTFVR